MESSDSGVSTAWLMATIGSRTTYRRVSKKDVNTVKIPQTCMLLTRPENLLRVCSSLMYGIALIYHQQVRHCLDHVSAIQQRLQKPIMVSSLLIASPESLTIGKNKRFHPLLDSASFLINNDFAPWEDEWFQNDQAIDMLHECFVENNDDSFQSASQSLQSLQDLSHQIDDGVEFDENGQLKQQIPNDLFLKNFDFDEEIRQAASLPLQETRSSADVNRTSATDPHFSTTLNQARSNTLDRLRQQRRISHHRKKIIVDCDNEQTLSDAEIARNMRHALLKRPYYEIDDVSKRPHTNTKEMMGKMASFEPAFLNHSRNYLFGEELTQLLPNDRLPNVHRRGKSAYGFFGEVEVGRNMQGIMEMNAEMGRNQQGEENFDDFSFDDFNDSILAYSLDSSMGTNGLHTRTGASQDNGTEGKLSKVAGKLLDYIYERVSQLGKVSDEFSNSLLIAHSKVSSDDDYDAPLRRISLTNILPPVKKVENDIVVSKKEAATSFAAILVLASTSELEIQVATHKEKISTPEKIFLKLP